MNANGNLQLINDLLDGENIFGWYYYQLKLRITINRKLHVQLSYFIMGLTI